MKSISTLVSAFLILLSCHVLADHPTLSLERGSPGPITTVSAIPLPKGKATVTVQGQFIFYDQIPDAELRKFSFLGEDVHSTESVFTTSAGGAFGITDDLMFGISLPYVWRENLRSAGHAHDEGEAHGEAAHHHDDHHGAEEPEAGSLELLGNSDGLGDLTLYGQWRFLGDAESNLHAALLYGIKVPTGRTDARTLDGALFETEHQPGSGSWDPLAGLALTRQFGRLSLDGSVLYFFSGEGSQSTTLGDILNYNLGLSYRVLQGEHDHDHHCPANCPDHCQEEGHEHDGKAVVEAPHSHPPIWDLILEFNGDWRDQQSVNGESAGNTGGNLIYLSAGSRLAWSSGWATTLSAGIPIMEDLNGFQSEPDVRVLLGISKAF